MTDKELLEFAAKAIGRMVLGWYNGEPTYAILEDESSWNPLLRDGDALRLAVSLGMTVVTSRGMTMAYVPNVAYWADENHGEDPGAATRRAITRAAAESAKVTP